MKKIVLVSVIALGLLLQSCNTRSKDVEMVSALQVYEAVYGEDSLQLIDVRTPEEYNVSHLKTAQNICISHPDFEAKVKKLDKNKPVYVYCKSGGRSAKASKKLKELGFTKVYDLQGGITSWEKEGLEIQN